MFFLTSHLHTEVKRKLPFGPFSAQTCGITVGLVCCEEPRKQNHVLHVNLSAAASSCAHRQFRNGCKADMMGRMRFNKACIFEMANILNLNWHRLKTGYIFSIKRFFLFLFVWLLLQKTSENHEAYSLV